MALKNVTNQQIVDALRLIGYGDDVLGGLSLAGKQNSEFVTRLVSAGIHSDDFDRAKEIARQVGDEKFNAGANQIDEIIGALQRRGVPDDTIRQIVAQAVTSPQNQPGAPGQPQISQGRPGAQTFDVSSRWVPPSTAIGGGPGAPAKLNVDALLAAASNYNSGATESVRHLMGATPGVSTPPPPSAQPATAPAATDFSGVGNADAMPGTAKPTPVGGAAPPKPAPVSGAGAATGAGTTGAPNNQPPPPATWNDDQIKTFIKQNFGSNAYFVDIPEVWDALKGVVKSGKGIGGLEPALEGTQFWLQNGANARAWYIAERKDPAQAAADVAKQTEAITNQAQAAGITLDPVRAQQMAQSYLRYGWSQTDLQRAIGAEWHYDPSTKNQAAAVTQMKSQAQDWLVPLSDQAIQTWGQGLISGTTTQEQYTQYLRDNAKSLMPQLSNLIDQHAGDPKFTVSTFADPYKQHAANLLGIQPDQINLNDSKWRQALDYADPKTGERRIMTLGEWESKVKTDKSFGYDNSANGIQDGLALAGALKQSMGF